MRFNPVTRQTDLEDEQPASSPCADWWVDDQHRVWEFLALMPRHPDEPKQLLGRLHLVGAMDGTLTASIAA